MKKTAKVLWLLLGFLCLGLGTIGIVLPILPTVPFYLVTLFAFTKSSERLHDWFVGTDLYKKNLDSFVQKKSMTMATKLKIVITVSIVMGIGFVMMKRVPVARVILAIVWVGHLIYFFGVVKTEKAEAVPEEAGAETPDGEAKA